MNGEEKLLQLPMAKSETLSVRQWCWLLGVTKSGFHKREIPPAYTDRNGREFYAVNSLPLTWQLELQSLKDQHRAQTYLELIEMLRVEKRWAPQKKWESYPASARNRAERRKAALSFYYKALEEGLTKEDAKIRAMDAWEDLFRKACTEKTIRNWVALIDERGGFQFAPMEAYLDGKSCLHHGARIEKKLPVRLGLTEEQFEELAAEIKARSVKPGMEHLSAVYQSLKLDWLMGRNIPGLGVRQGNADFPLNKGQVRAFAASTGARRLGSHGEAQYNIECAPFIHTSTKTLRPLELLVLDDTRIDLVCHHDLNPSRLIELKAYVVMDVATRRILGFTVKEGALGKEDVSALLARVLRGFGLPTKYKMHILFERGAVACAPASETLLTSMWPGRIEVHRTSMDGGTSDIAGFCESRSGHWMGKPWIESFMRTLAILLEHLPGQRGGQYRRQPAMLGLKGREHTTGRLLYDKGNGPLSTQMHEAALTAWANLCMEWIEGGLGKDARPRLKSSPLRPKQWVIDQIAQTIALYNDETDHNREGFARIEFQCPKTGKVKHRMESCNERWLTLSRQWPAERIHPADAATLLRYRGKAVTCDARNGVVFDLTPFKGLRFWKPDSVSCHMAGQLATKQKKFVALYDAEAFRTWRPDCGWPLEIHMIVDANPATWKPGDEGRYWETLPLYGSVNRMDAAAMAQAAADKARIVRRAKLELVQAVGPTVARKLADLEQDEAQLHGVVVRMNLDQPQLPQSEFSKSISVADESAQPLKRKDQQPRALTDLEKFQQAHAVLAIDNEVPEEEPEVF